MLQAAGIATVVAKGMAKVDCFRVPARSELPADLTRYPGASRTGLLLGVAKRLGELVSQIVANLRNLYGDRALNLASSPMLTHFFTFPEALTPGVLDSLEADVQRKLQVRQASFDALVDGVEAGGDPTAEISAHPGLVAP